MTHDLAFLHTLASNVDVFTPLVTERRPDLRIRHAVADHVLNEARKTGMTPEIAREVQSFMIDLASTGARVVVCTCSTIGGAAEATETGGRFAAMRIDRPMADRAVTLGPLVRGGESVASMVVPTCAIEPGLGCCCTTTPVPRMASSSPAWRAAIKAVRVV